MVKIKNPERLEFIRKNIDERGIEEIFSIDDARKKNIVQIMAIYLYKSRIIFPYSIKVYI